MIFYIATTFREFDGSDNDRIQRLFLERLSKEKFSNLKLLVTTFGEKNVKSVLDQYGLAYNIFEENKVGYRFSLTNVVSNAIAHSDIKANDFMIWTTCDVIFDENFFQILRKYIKLYETPLSVISHPHLIYKDIDALSYNLYEIHGPNDGIDFIGFSGSALSQQLINDIDHNFFSDWGVFEHFLVAAAVKNKLKRINVFCESKAKKITNDRAVLNESAEYFNMSLNKNWPVLREYLKINDMSTRFSSLVYCNLMYPQPNILQTIIYKSSFFTVYASYILDLFFIPFWKVLPEGVKSKIRWVFKK